jgi:ChpA-C
MHKWTVRAARVALVAAAITAAGTGVANADNTTGDHSILGGEQIHIPIIAPIGLFGNHVNVLSSVVPVGARYAQVPMADPAPAPAPQVDICGNAISSAHGVGTAACQGQASVGGPSEAAPTALAWPVAQPVAQPAAQPVEQPVAQPMVDSASVGAPVNAIGAPGSPVIAQSEPAAPAPADVPAAAPIAAPAAAPEAPAAAPEMPAAAPEMPVAAPEAPAPEAAPAAPIAAPESGPAEMVTSGENGVLSGNQVKAPVRAPIRICGNAGALGGVATAACEGTASSGRFAHRAYRSFGVAGLLG